jgi:hypothetical protein
MRLKNLPPSEVIEINAFSTSLNHTLPLSTRSLTSHSVTQNCFASSAISGTPAFENCLSSVQYNWFAVLTCPYAYAICCIGAHTHAATSQRILREEIILSCSIPNAKSCFAVSLIPVNSKGVFCANVESSESKS